MEVQYDDNAHTITVNGSVEDIRRCIRDVARSSYRDGKSKLSQGAKSDIKYLTDIIEPKTLPIGVAAICYTKDSLQYYPNPRVQDDHKLIEIHYKVFKELWLGYTRS